MSDARRSGSVPHVLLGLIGSPIGSSAAPAMHEAAADAVGLRAHYQLIDVAGADAARLRALLDAVRTMRFHGVNVTFPYKEAVIPLLDGLSDGARRVGAVNTVVVEDGRLVGHNTDATGFASALRGRFGEAVRGPFALVGAGGVGKAAAVALSGLSGDEIRVFDADPRKAEAVAAALGGSARACAGLEAALDGARGLVNGTPVGMLPNRDSPVPLPLLRPDLWVADAVYTPLWTPLLKAARDLGAAVMTGRDLAIHQALDAFRLFTGREAPHAAMAASFDAVMAARDRAA